MPICCGRWMREMEWMRVLRGRSELLILNFQIARRERRGLQPLVGRVPSPQTESDALKRSDFKIPTFQNAKHGAPTRPVGRVQTKATRPPCDRLRATAAGREERLACSNNGGKCAVQPNGRSRSLTAVRTTRDRVRDDSALRKVVTRVEWPGLKPAWVASSIHRPEGRCSHRDTHVKGEEGFLAALGMTSRRGCGE